jgi:hypothetical protein
MTDWTMSEYIEQHPDLTPLQIAQVWYPGAGDSASRLVQQIQDYRDSLSSPDGANATLKAQLNANGSMNLPEEKDPIVLDEVPPIDQEDPIWKNIDSSEITGIWNYTTIGGEDVSNNVISMNTSQVCDANEGNEQSTCTIVLNNNYQKYGKILAAYRWVPRRTTVWSAVASRINGEIWPYMFFTGFMSDAKWDHETATIEFCCSGEIAGASYDDDSWSPEEGYHPKMQDLVDAINDGNQASGEYKGIELTLLDMRTSKQELIKQDFAPSDMSGGENLRAIANSNKGNFYYVSDFEGENHYIAIYDGKTNTGYMELNDYIINPGDVSVILGHANIVDMIAGTIAKEKEKKHVPSPVKNEVLSHKENADSIQKYGRIPNFLVHEPNLDVSQVNIANDIMEENYEQYIDRDIKITIANIVPKLLTVVSFQMPDLQSNELTWIFAGVRKKQVEYSSSGIISRLECQRLTDDEKKEMEAQLKGVTLLLESELFGEDRYTYYWRDGKWDLWVTRGNGVGNVEHVDNPPQDVIDWFKDRLKAIEDNNDINDPNWRTLSYNG